MIKQYLTWLLRLWQALRAKHRQEIVDVRLRCSPQALRAASAGCPQAATFSERSLRKSVDSLLDVKRKMCRWAYSAPPASIVLGAACFNQLVYSH
jgi:transposase